MTLKGTVWTPMGPSPVAENGLNCNGLTTAIAINPNDSNIIYQGTAGGGLWRSIDGGSTWTSLFDRQLSLGIGEPSALAIDPNNTDTIYVGTSGRVNQQPQAGLFRSTDGGASWVQMGSGYPAGNTGNVSQFVGQWINVIIVDPSNSNIIYLGSTNGVFRSVDGGLNWVAGTNAGGDARSLVLDASTPASSRILYAGLSGRGVFQSTDGGQSWTQILSAATPAVAAAISAGGFTTLSKVIVAAAPPSSPPNSNGIQVLYVALQGSPPPNAPDLIGLFISIDQGGTWTRQAASAVPSNTQNGYSVHMAIDPGSPGKGINDVIYFGAVGQAKSTDSGNSFTGITGMHADTHSWSFFPQPSPTSSIVYCGTDGGLSRSTDGGSTWMPLSGGGLQTGLFYNIDVKPDATGSVTVGALQDNEVETTKGATTTLGWVATSGGDGWDVAYDAVTPGRVYSSSGFYSAGAGQPPVPCTEVFRSDDDGATFPTNITPWTTATDAGCYLAPVTTDPSTASIVYVSGSQNLWQSQDGGNTWRILASFSGAGNVEVAKANGNNVVIAVGSQVFLSSNALAATVGSPLGVTFINITRNLPSRNVTRAAFDPNDPTVIYAVLGGFSGGLGGHVFRTTISATSWTDISPPLDLPFSAIALDGSGIPTTIYVGTDLGVLRSVDGGSSWSVLDDIHFPRAPVTDLVLNQNAGVLRAATYGRGVFDFVKPAGPAVTVNLEHGLAFGTVCSGPQYLTLKIFNVGAQDLVINSVQRLMGSTSFSVLSTPSSPLVVAPGEDIEFTVVYNPTAPGIAETSTIRISSNDPTAPFVDLSATGLLGTPSLASAIANNGNIGSVCLGSFAEEELIINNTGSCPLSISNISSSSAEFIVPNVATYPLVVSPGVSLVVTIRFQPTSFGAKSATLTLLSDDPASPGTVTVSGVALAPRLNMLVSDYGNLGDVCIGSFVDEPLILTNSGQCTLSVTSITSSGIEFLVPQVSAYPVTIAAGVSLEVPIRFQPTGFGPRSATITVTSDDPASPQTITLSGNAPSGKVAVTGSACFGGVQAYCCAERTISICNVGDCNLNVTSVVFKRKSHHWKLINDPFPATLHPGSCLGVAIQYKATEKCPRCMELVITSDDPNTPVKTLDVMAYTIWSDCGCKRCCEDCRKGCCEKTHKECCCCEGRQGYPCCDDDEDEEKTDCM
jgi:Abnormal spindle-like microcephaly-assoc'd, ASPM-SPD-2-Hydin